MPRQGLNREIILRKAVDLINKDGYSNLTLAALAAEFNVKPPALFKHYKNLDGLKESLTLYGISILKQCLQDALTGKAGEHAVAAMCHAYRNFARSNTGLYQAIQPYYFRKNKTIEDAAMQIMIIMTRVLDGFNIEQENYIHLLRVIRSSLHGFVVLEFDFGFGVTGSIDLSFEHQINSLIALIKSVEH